MATEMLREQKRRANRWRLTAITLIIILSLVLLGLFGMVTGKFGNYIIADKTSPTVTVQSVKVRENG